jgi:UDP-glucose 4-epimerase
MNFLITGAAGFLGSSLANNLSREGHQVRGLDDLSTGDPQALSPDVLFTRGDVSDRPKLWTLLQEVDVVYHFAARVSVPESILYPRDYNTVNVGGTVSLMEAMRDVGVRRVVLGSSGAVYGDLAGQPLRESVTPNPRSPYAVSKLAAEYYVRTIGRLWGIETVSLRIFNAYGPGQHLPASHPPVVPYFLRQAQRGGTLVVHGEGRGCDCTKFRWIRHQRRLGYRNESPRAGQPCPGRDERSTRSHLQLTDFRRCLTHGRRFDSGTGKIELPSFDQAVGWIETHAST